MKTIYFVRHGESEGNAGPLQQGEDAPLTEKGHRQAEFVAKRCAKLPLEAIVCSTMIRARQTAEHILKKVPKPIEYSGLFVERRRSSAVAGKRKDSPEATEAREAAERNYHIPGWRHSDEENFEDQKERVAKILEYLSGRPEEHILVVSHGFILRIVVAYIHFGEALTGELCNHFIRTLHMENTGLTILGYDESKPQPWWLWVWNDHAHLG